MLPAKSSACKPAGWLWLALVVLPVALAACGGRDKPKGAGTAPPGKNGESSESQLIKLNAIVEIVMEAESAKVTAPMVIRTDDASQSRSELQQASGGKYVDLPEKAGKGDEVGGKVTFTVDIKQRGTYRLWARVWWTDSCGNTFGVVVDDGKQATLGDDGTCNSWQWVCLKGDAGVFRLPKGEHTIEFRNTEDGVRLDEILLSTNTDEQAPPQGIVSP